MLGVGRARGPVTVWNPFIGRRLPRTAVQEIHAEKEHGQEDEEPGYDSPVAPRHDVPLYEYGKHIQVDESVCLSLL